MPFFKTYWKLFISILKQRNKQLYSYDSSQKINQRDLIIYNQDLSSFLYPFFLFPMILWEAQGAEERGYEKMMLDLLERGKHFSLVLESFFLVAGKVFLCLPIL